MEIILLGGSHDGVRLEGIFQDIVYITTRLLDPNDDAFDLRIDEVHCWRFPEDVYIRYRDTRVFKYKHTLHYKPRKDGNQCEIRGCRTKDN
jgi:hypothetical protein